jgi:hypothetical protein
MSTGYAVSDVLAPRQIVGVFSRVKPALRTLSTLFGFQVGGSNRTRYEGVGRSFSYDTFNSTRKVAPARLPGQPSQTIEPQKVGSVKGEFPRVAFKMDLLDEKLSNQRQIGGAVTQLDAMGQSYITRQEMFMGEQLANVIEFQTAAMLRGAYYYANSGNDLFHEFSSSGAVETIDFQIPSGNKSTLNMLGGGALISTWNDTVNIPAQLLSIKKAMQQLNGFTPTNIVCKSPLWTTVVNNDYVIQQGGSAQEPFKSFEMDTDGNIVAVLRGLPWLKWHVIDHGLEIGTGGTYTDLIDDNYFSMFPDPSAEWCQYLDGREVVTQGPGVGAPRVEEYGTYAYAHPRHDPSGWSMYGGHNGIPQLTVPSAVVYGNAG